jgi:hypothetical protein
MMKKEENVVTAHPQHLIQLERLHLTAVRVGTSPFVSNNHVEGRARWEVGIRF